MVLQRFFTPGLAITSGIKNSFRRIPVPKTFLGDIVRIDVDGIFQPFMPKNL